MSQGQEHFYLVTAMKQLSGGSLPLTFGSIIPAFLQCRGLSLLRCAVRDGLEGLLLVKESPLSPPPEPRGGKFATVQYTARDFNLL